MEKTKGSNIFQIVLVALLVGAAFYIGGLSSKVDRLEKDSTAAGSEGSANEVPVPEVFDYASVASALGIDVNAMSSCMDNGDAATRVREETKSGEDAGVQGTPGMILLDNNTGLSIVIPGAVPIELMQQFLDGLLTGKNVVLENNEFEVIKNDALAPLSDNDFVRGSRTARVTLFEYSDYDCPFCSKVHPTIQQLLDDNPDVVSWVYRQFPLDMHPQAFRKSEAAVCAGIVGGNDAFWAYSDELLK